MLRKTVYCLSGVIVAVTLIAQNSSTEAPAGFDTPANRLNPGSGSASNGIVEPTGDTFANDQAFFEKQEDANDGVGPVLNAASCITCHANPVTGGASQITEIRVGHLDANGNFVNPSVPINGGADMITGRSLINDRAVCPEAQEHVPATETIRALRAVLNTLGDGFVEAIDDSTFITIAHGQPSQSKGVIAGQAVQVPVLESPGKTRVGRFGWKNQHSSLLSFVGDAYLNEMGVTNRLRPTDSTSVCKAQTDIEDKPDDLGMANIDHFTQFIRGTKVPPRDTVLGASADAQAGQHVFETIGCNICHVESITTAAPGTVMNGGAFTVPDALGNKVIHPFGDFLLHDVGTGDHIVQGGLRRLHPNFAPHPFGVCAQEPASCTIWHRSAWRRRSIDMEEKLAWSLSISAS
jgi:CxxC motif-containing protein (DUF1111 family)